MTRVAEALNLVFHGIKTGERAELFADVERWLQEMDDRSGARPPVTHTGRGRCIHNVPICGECQTNHVLLHVADIERVRSEAATPPTTPSDAAMRAAEEVAANYEVHKDHCHSNERYPSPPCDCGATEEVAAIITRHLAAKEQK